MLLDVIEKVVMRANNNRLGILTEMNSGALSALGVVKIYSTTHPNFVHTQEGGAGGGKKDLTYRKTSNAAE